MLHLFSMREKDAVHMKMTKGGLLRDCIPVSKNNVVIQQTCIRSLHQVNQFTEQDNHSGGDVTGKSSYLQEESKRSGMSSSEKKALGN